MAILGQVENTDEELWKDDFGNRVFITAAHTAIGMCFGGRCVVKPMQEWVNLGWNGTTEDRIERLEAAVRELNPGLRI